MKLFRLKLATTAAFMLVIGAAVSALTATIAHAACEPVVCPAIVKICPQGQLACRPSPCSCAQVCAAEGHGCNAGSEPLISESGSLDGVGLDLVSADAILMTPAEPAAASSGQFCGGVAEIPCPEGFVCVPAAGCDPLIDQCPGRCKRSR